VQIVLSALIAVRLWLRRNKQAVGGTSAERARAERTAKLAKMVISTSAINAVWYLTAIIDGIFGVCANACMSDELVEQTTSFTIFIIYVSGLVSELNSALCFAFQCLLSSMYRKALSEVFAPVCGRCCCASTVSPAVAGGNGATSTTAQSNQRPAKGRSAQVPAESVF